MFRFIAQIFQRNEKKRTKFLERKKTESRFCEISSQDLSAWLSRL